MTPLDLSSPSDMRSHEVTGGHRRLPAAMNPRSYSRGVLGSRRGQLICSGVAEVSAAVVMTSFREDSNPGQENQVHWLTTRPTSSEALTDRPLARLQSQPATASQSPSGSQRRRVCRSSLHRTSEDAKLASC
ncbi:hypothetical protein O3P69_009506 [Scylla paramamosain]|uniref:Uncharacterized protein n=1 Tax=Scylla paramamosain TaxID=85552 RepID=A0AAW0SVW4_SCYPA